MGYTSKKGVIGFPWISIVEKNETTSLADENVTSSLATTITAAAAIAAAIAVAISAATAAPIAITVTVAVACDNKSHSNTRLQD